MNRKWVLILFLCALVLVGCGLNSNCNDGKELGHDSAANPFESETYERSGNPYELSEVELQELMNDVKILHESFYNEWEREDESCLLHLDCVPDAETALILGNLLLTQFQKTGHCPGYSVQLISYQEDPEVWIISCWKNADTVAEDNSLSFAIRKDDAQVLCTWLSTEITRDDTGRAKIREQEEALRKIRYLKEEQYNNWKQVDDDFVITEKWIPDAESALLFGDTLLRQYQREGAFPKYTPQQISYQADPEIWIISCWEDLGPESTSSSVSFAIRADDAQVVSVYLSE